MPGGRRAISVSLLVQQIHAAHLPATRQRTLALQELMQKLNHLVENWLRQEK